MKKVAVMLDGSFVLKCLEKKLQCRKKESFETKGAPSMLLSCCEIDSKSSGPCTCVGSIATSGTRQMKGADSWRVGPFLFVFRGVGW